MTATEWTMDMIRDAMRARGSHWFDQSTIRFFGSRILPTVYQGPGGVFFVTSEQPPHGPRKYSVRQFRPEDTTIDTVGDFCSIPTRAAAVRDAKSRAAGDA